jgi:molybdate transport system ATP-binding protein
MSVRRNLVYGMPRGGGTVDFDQIVALLDLERLLERRPATLSGGEKQRVAIGRALLASPRLLLMDEPLAALDSARKDEILPFIERLRDGLELPIVYVTHQMNEIVRLAETLVLMSDGRVAAVGELEALMSRLDLRPLTGRYEAGAVINAEIEGHDVENGLSRVAFAGGTLLVPLVDLPPGERLRIRIRARDVSLALTRPSDISILNIFRGAITEIGDGSGAQVDVLLDIGTPLWARVTRYTARRFDLRPGLEVYALIKAVAIDRHSLGRTTIRRRSHDTGPEKTNGPGN